ncbi:uncharacterized protein LACBIDRAFT_325479 [Laccaria bicolor S238N-H82]|uniref:Predicted protein n=1 Tax=Laccaria bicolor (strain S238N-H82 / ATCC MYA-4686) TaxID=486041 RepID=B0D526_LACBS|nr:uncharacterized protein LACBIDRAFT_325479 [Laccaria bicolor S238N-H82]EDR10448.1 predicted protein [Laccaria bicolor S238N-H82]|eukprot:XP_001878898.1 predicted protein [Laccaria bicolor S238N-H82]
MPTAKTTDRPFNGKKGISKSSNPIPFTPASYSPRRALSLSLTQNTREEGEVASRINLYPIPTLIRSSTSSSSSITIPLPALAQKRLLTSPNFGLSYIPASPCRRPPRSRISAPMMFIVTPSQISSSCGGFAMRMDWRSSDLSTARRRPIPHPPDIRARCRNRNRALRQSPQFVRNANEDGVGKGELYIFCDPKFDVRMLSRYPRKLPPPQPLPMEKVCTFRYPTLELPFTTKSTDDGIQGFQI